MAPHTIDEMLDVLSSALYALKGHAGCSCLHIDPKTKGIQVKRKDLTYSESDCLGNGAFGVVYKGNIACFRYL